MASVAVLGGGVAGLSAAHELAERGFAVAVYEARDLFGGKARSFGVPGSGTGGRADLPAEHGFRFFPGFYKHLPDTMRRIPFPGRPDGVAGNLVTATRALLAQAGGRNELIGVDAPDRRARRPHRAEPLPARLGHEGGGPRPRARDLRRAAAHLPHQLRRAAPGAVRAPELVGVRRRRPPQRRLRQVLRRRAHPHARRRPRARDERAHRRAGPPAAAVRPHAARAVRPTGCSTRPPRRPGSRRGSSTCGPAASRCTTTRRSPGSSSTGAASPACGSAAGTACRPSGSPPTSTWPRSRSSSCGC